MINLKRLNVVKFLQKKDRYCLYKVSGHSMEDDLIYPKDLLLVDKKARIKNKDIVVAFVSKNNYLIKHLIKRDGHLIFYPFGKNSPETVIDTAIVKGKVIAIIHKK